MVQKLSGIAGREVPGVYGMGNIARRTFDAISERMPGSRAQVSEGVSVGVGASLSGCGIEAGWAQER